MNDSLDKLINSLEELEKRMCGFHNVCAESNYGSLHRCRNDYLDCPHYSKYIKEQNDWQDKYHDGE